MDRNSSPYVRLAFSLIELLVVIAIVATLMSLLVPALGRARALSRQSAELAGAFDQGRAFALYADENKSMLLPGYCPRRWVNGPMVVRDQSGERISDEPAQRYPWRLAPHMNYEFRGMYQDARVLRAMRSDAPRDDEYRYVVSLFPSLGMNASFVGGSDRVQEFDSAFLRVFGRVYVHRIDSAVRPSGVLAFVSARGEEQSALPTLGRPEGFFRVEPPVFTASAGRQWESSYVAGAAQPGRNSGFVSLRHSGRAVGQHLDGHAEMLSWEQLNDMRRWADQADKPDWGISAR